MRKIQVQGLVIGATLACVAATAYAAGLQDIAHSTAGIYVAARDDGAVSRSNTNGVTYSVYATGGTAPLHGVAYAANWFVAVGDGGRAVRSSDGGLHWAADNSRTTARLREITAHANALYFIAVGDAGTTLRKQASAAAWDTTFSPTAKPMYSVASNGISPGMLVAVGDGGTVLRSTDQGLSWTVLAALPGAPSLRGVAGGAANNLFVAVGRGGKIFRSSDIGFTWEDVSNPAAVADLNDVASDRSNRFVAVGEGGVIVRSGTNAGPGSWLPVASGISVPLAGVHHDGVYFYAVGGSESVFRSLDGTSWLNVPVAPATWSAVKRRFGGGR